MSQIEKIRFPGAQGSPLAAIINWPEDAPRAFCISSHCFTCSKDTKATYWTSRTLAERGLAVLRFDFSGLGDSGGDFSNSSFSSNVEDILAAASYLREHHQAPKLLVGHSLGGTASLATAARIPEVTAVATIGSPLEPLQLKRHLPSDAGSAEEVPEEVEVEILGRTFRLGRRFFEDLEQHDMTRVIKDLGRALMVMHAPYDSIVSVEEAGRIFQAARHPKSFVALDGADHLLSDREAARYAGNVIAAWAQRFL